MFLAAALAVAQQFEVASVRPSGPDSPHGSDGGPGHKGPTRFSCGSCSLNLFIQIAWNVRPFQISSAQSLEKDVYDVAVNVPLGATKEDFRIMLQNLLKDRFGLKFHEESREFAGYGLVVAKAGFALKDGETSVPPRQATVNETPWPEFATNAPKIISQLSGAGEYTLVRIKGHLQPISALVGMLYPYMPENRPLVDETGLTGKYSFEFEYTIEHPGSTSVALPPAPSLFTALQQEFGLQLVAKKLPFSVLVVESFNRVPSEN
jgi:uncharacterized protein (TIGR03435 family)